MSAQTLTWTVAPREGYPLPVLNGQVSIDATRIPQVTASLSVPYSTKADVLAFDPFTRKPCYLSISTSNFVPGGTLATFNTPTPIPGTPGTPAIPEGPPTEVWTVDRRNLAVQPVPGSSASGWTNGLPSLTSTAIDTTNPRRAGSRSIRATRTSAPVITPGPDVEYPAELLATDTIPGSDAGGWANISGTALTTATTNTRSAPRCLYVANSGGSTNGKEFSGFVPGRSYTVSVWYRHASTGTTGAVGVQGIGAAAATTAGVVNVYMERTYTFVATSTTHTVTFYTSGLARVDDITITRNAYTAAGPGIPPENADALAVIENIGTTGAGGRMVVPAGGYVTATLHIDVTAATYVQTVWTFYTAAGALIGQNGASGDTLAPGSWTRVESQIPVPASATRAALTVNAWTASGAPAVGGEQVRVTDLLVLGADDVNTLYFDGSTSPSSAAERFSWTGTSGLSQSVREARSYLPGTPAVPATPGTPEQPGTPGTLATLDWSNKASRPAPLGAAAAASETHNLRLYVTDVSVNEMAGTLDVQLASADVFLTELRNLGNNDWEPAHIGYTGQSKRVNPNAVFEEFFDAFDIPLSIKPSVITNVLWFEAWERGEVAWPYLNALRVQADLRARLNVTTGVLALVYAPSMPYASIDRSNATAVSYRRSVETSVEGNSYADAILRQYEYADVFNQPDTWMVSLSQADWRRSRRSVFESERSGETYYTVQQQSTLDYRLSRASRARRLTTVTIPVDPRAFPFADLATHPHAASIVALTFDYPSGDVTTTYVEQDN